MTANQERKLAVQRFKVRQPVAQDPIRWGAPYRLREDGATQVDFDRERKRLRRMLDGLRGIRPVQPQGDGLADEHRAWTCGPLD